MQMFNVIGLSSCGSSNFSQAIEHDRPLRTFLEGNIWFAYMSLRVSDLSQNASLLSLAQADAIITTFRKLLSTNAHLNRFYREIYGLLICH